MATHHFESTGEAYDATQCRDDIAAGDVLVIVSEQVIGLADTWPIAVTMAYGKLHSPAADFSVADCLEGRKAIAGLEAAKAAAVALGYPLHA